MISVKETLDKGHMTDITEGILPLMVPLFIIKMVDQEVTVIHDAPSQDSTITEIEVKQTTKI